MIEQDEVVEVARRGVILALVADVFFAVNVRNAIRKLGFEPRIVKTADDLVDAASGAAASLAIIDLHAMRLDADWDSITDLALDGPATLVFGAHRDVDGLRRAKTAGVTRVVSNGQFHREMGELIERYAVEGAAVEENDDDLFLDDEPLDSLPPGMARHYTAEAPAGTFARN